MSAQTQKPDFQQRVLRVTQSPMNPLIWVLDLACGHETTLAQKKRPTLMRTWTDKTTREILCGARKVACWRCKDAYLTALSQGQDAGR